MEGVGDRVNYWSSPETSSVNRLPMLNIEHIEKMSLDGTWRFQLLKNPKAPLGKKWSEIPVPGLWTMQPKSSVFFDSPIYTNIKMPFSEVPPEVPTINPTGVYERTFDIPTLWERKRIVLVLGGAESMAVVYMNDHEIGMSKDSRLAAEFDVTSFVHVGRNTVRVLVPKWSDATYLEDQDQWWHGGITRSVKIYATAEVFIGKLHTTAGFDLKSKAGTLRIDVGISSINQASITGYSFRSHIAECEGIPGSTFTKSIKDARSGSFLFENQVDRIKPWSAEEPNLYTLVHELVDPQGVVVEMTSQKIGFRDVRISRKHFLVNGQPVMFYGINRHDFNRKTGRVVSREDMREDLLEMKRWNFNAVRTSHYPNHPAFYDLCDELGIYVIDEANIESHAFIDDVCNDARYLGAFVERVGRMIQRDIHHPSIVMWSLGNESGVGTNHFAASAYARAFDPSRPLHYEGAIREDWAVGHALTDVISPMYPELADIVAFVKSGKQDRPIILSEYSHAMGNSNGTLSDYWKVFEQTDGLQGGFIWEFWDHALDQEMPDRSVRSAYGGDFGETIHDGNFCCDGMVFPDRTPKPAMREFKQIACPISITAKQLKTGRFDIFNKQFFRDLTDFDIFWTITRDGEAIESGQVIIPKVGPRKQGSFTIDPNTLNKIDGRGERFVNFTIRRKSGTAWTLSGSEIGWAQIPLPSRALKLPAKPPGSTKATKLDTGAIIDTSGLIYIPYLRVAPALTLWRAPIDNDRLGGISAKWDEWGIQDLTRTDCVITATTKHVKIANTFETLSGVKLNHIQIVTPLAEGISVAEQVTLPKVLDDVARIGTVFELSETLNSLKWFGVGPHETYPDRALGLVHQWSGSVESQHVPYIRPQENGGHVGVRWFELREGDGPGVRFELSEPAQVSVSRFRDVMLSQITHEADLMPSGNTVVHIDAAHRGLGTASCGPDTLDKYKIAPGKYLWEWRAISI
jgi:beta-galactosidase